MNIKQMNYVITLEEEGNTIQAAKKLGISQSTLSKYIANLEKSLGVSLFVRNQKQLIPTIYGKIYIDAARRILQIYQFTYRSISNMNGSDKTDLFVGIPKHLNIKLQMFLMTKFHEMYPYTMLHLEEYQSTEAIKQMQNHTLSFALVNMCTEFHQDFSYLPVTEDELILAVPNGSMTTCHSLKDLRNIPLILPPQNTDLRFYIDSLFSAIHLEPMIACETERPDLRLELVKQNVGSSILLRSQITDDESIHYIHLDEGYKIKKNIAYRKGHLLTAPEQFCLNLIQQYYNLGNCETSSQS